MPAPPRRPFPSSSAGYHYQGRQPESVVLRLYVRVDQACPVHARHGPDDAAVGHLEGRQRSLGQPRIRARLCRSPAGARASLRAARTRDRRETRSTRSAGTCRRAGRPGTACRLLVWFRAASCSSRSACRTPGSRLLCSTARLGRLSRPRTAPACSLWRASRSSRCLSR